MVPDQIVQIAGFVLIIFSLILVVGTAAVWVYLLTRNPDSHPPETIQRQDETDNPRSSDLIIEIRISDGRGADPSPR